MTVTPCSGDAEGDAGGDPVTPPPATVQARSKGGKSPERPLGGRFWVLESDDEDGDALEEISSLGDIGSFRYLCRSPEAEKDRDLKESSQELARRAVKRINRQQQQRRAAMEFMVTEGTSSSPIKTPLGRSVLRGKPVNVPILEPSVFDDDGQEGWTVVRRRRWSPASGKRSSDPMFSGLSKSRGMGPMNIRPRIDSVFVRGGPELPIHRRPVRTLSDRSAETDRPIQVKVGGAVAGRAFRHLLGFAWRKFEKGEQVVQRRTSNPLMNGEGGHGGFNPGQGGFNHGRGGFQARGGFGNGRSGNAARGRLGQGGGRGGQGFTGGRGYQGNGNAAFGRNYVQGESSGTAGMGNFVNSRDENWGGQRNFNSNFHNNNRAGYGNNQHRWVSQNNVGRGGGFQQRYRGNGDGAAARGSIDADLLHQTVQAVVAAVTAVQKVPEVNNASGTSGALGTHGQVMSVVDPTVVLQQSTVINKDVVEPQVVQGTAKENEGLGPSKKKKEDKDACFRCKKPGHYIDDCTTPFCDICESIHHVSSACHLLQAPKPTAIIHGYANEALMFFELPCGAFKAKVENPKLAKVTVEGEVMTIPEIIEQLKRIVPYEKFHWEVFHYKDNIYIVKLPSKQEVQRLKNFGSYMCPQKETFLFFDLWSSVEEPLYMLPEVWVRVSGVPSDMRADYLSLWGVGSLFWKTLDVDMPFTRKNKMRRIKIGCLDRNLIPADSDVFIRRGLYKLRFEVEAAHVSQEVNMVEANNSKDGGGDPNNGAGNIDGGNAMDMDTKGAEDDATSNNNGQVENNTKSGVEGMQEQCKHVDEIQIGTLKVQLSPTGSASFDSNLGEKIRFYKPILHVENLPLSNKSFTDFHADSLPGRSSSGLPKVGSCALCLDAALSADSQRMHSRRCSGCAPASVCMQQAGQSAAPAFLPEVEVGVVPAVGVLPFAESQQRAAEKLTTDSMQSARHAEPLPANGMQGTSLMVGSAGDQRSRGVAPEAGSAVAVEKVPRPPSTTPLAQKIRAADAAAPAAVTEGSANHWAHDEPMMGPVLAGLVGSSVHNNAEGKGVFTDDLNFDNTSVDIDLCMPSIFSLCVSHGSDINDAGPFLHPTLVGSLEKHRDGALENALLDKKGEKNTVDLQGRMRNASSMKTTVCCIFLHVDEQAVLKHFDWPERRADALRDAAAKHEWLIQLDKQISSFVDDRALHRDAALGKMYSLFEKTEKSVFKFVVDRDTTDKKTNLIARYKEQDIPVGWMSDTGLIVKVELACVNLARQYMMRVVLEIDGLSGTNKNRTKETALFKHLKEQNRQVLLHQGVRFAFRVHQFSGGFTAQSLKRRHNEEQINDM
ncbi:hypothetical protein ACQ4PT_043194 [Festuca glaucescens]